MSYDITDYMTVLLGGQKRNSAQGASVMLLLVKLSWAPASLLLQQVRSRTE